MPTITKSLTVQNEGTYVVDMSAYITNTITVHSAANDTISFTDETGFKTCTTDSTGEAIVSITILYPSENIIFLSTIAWDPTNLSDNYQKTVTVTDQTTDVWIMPDTTLYWFGNNVDSMAGYAYRSSGAGNTARAPGVTYSTNYVQLTMGKSSPFINGCYASTTYNDMSDYTSVKLLVKASDFHGGPDYGSGAALYVTSQLKDNYTNDGVATIISAARNKTVTITTPTIISLNVSSVTNSDVVTIHMSNTNGAANHLEIYALWLE